MTRTRLFTRSIYKKETISRTLIYPTAAFPCFYHLSFIRSPSADSSTSQISISELSSLFSALTLLHRRPLHASRRSPSPVYIASRRTPSPLYKAASVDLSFKERSMAYSQACNFLFCNYCGTKLVMVAKYVTCPLCKFKRNAEEVAEKEISYTVTAEDIRRELGLSLFDTEGDNKVQWSKVKRTCEKCQNPEMHYTTRQTRSADEGQTTHYLCPRCGYQCQES